MEEDHTDFVGQDYWGFQVWSHHAKDCVDLDNHAPNGRSFSPKEQSIADAIKQRTGLDATPNPLEGVAGAGRQVDALIAGVKHEFKTLDPGATANTIKNVVNNSIRKGVKHGTS